LSGLADGARITYATVGGGPALVVSRQAISHLGLEWEETRVRDFWETIGRYHLMVRYDKQGCGLSDRNRTDFSLDSEVRTIEAIVKELGLKSFVLWGDGGQGAVAAIAYTVRFPDRVSHLILYGAQARWHRVPDVARTSLRRLHLYPDALPYVFAMSIRLSSAAGQRARGARDDLKLLHLPGAARVRAG
jgi:pimeloyl-ACP methyl ester carboxylesterase